MKKNTTSFSQNDSGNEALINAEIGGYKSFIPDSKSSPVEKKLSVKDKDTSKPYLSPTLFERVFKV